MCKGAGCRGERTLVRHSWGVIPRLPTRRLTATLLAGSLAVVPLAMADSGAPPTKPPEQPPAAEPGGPGAEDAPQSGAPAPGGPAVPGGVSVSGLQAGSGSVDIREYVDLSSAASGVAHQRIVRTLLSRVAAEGLGSVSLRPLITSTDLNSTEAGCAVLAAGTQNKAWDVTAALFRAQAAGGDWVNPTVLRRIGSHINGLKVNRFINDARGPANYSGLNAIRSEAKAAGVTVTPAFVVRGPGGTKLVTQPGSAAVVIDAIKSVQ